MELPINKPSINGKFKTTNAIKSSIYQILEKNKVEGRYTDDNWQGVSKLKNVLAEYDVTFELVDAGYSGNHEVEGSPLPTKKIYRFKLEIRNKEGKNIELFLKVTCAFIGKTGTMTDDTYELTYYFF